MLRRFHDCGIHARLYPGSRIEHGSVKNRRSVNTGPAGDEQLVMVQARQNGPLTRFALTLNPPLLEESLFYWGL